MLCFRTGGPLEIQQKAFATERIHDAVQLIGYQAGAVALTGIIVIENQDGIIWKGSWEVGEPLTIWGKVTGHISKVGWNRVDGRHFWGGHGKIKG